jgi:hypothetical protein
MTFFHKRVFPLIWFGILILGIARTLLQSWFGESPPATPPPVLIVPALMLVFGCFLMKILVFNLVDEVIDAGDALIVRNRGLEERIALTDIANVDYPPFAEPPRVTLSLRNPGTFGDRVTFLVSTSSPSFVANQIVDELTERVDAARQGGFARRGAR